MNLKENHNIVKPKSKSISKKGTRLDLRNKYNLHFTN